MTRGDAIEFEMVILWDGEKSATNDIIEYIDEFGQQAFILTDIRRIKKLQNIIQNISYHVLSLKWLVTKQISDMVVEDYVGIEGIPNNGTIYQKCLVETKSFSKHFILLPGGKILNGSKYITSKSVILLLTKNKLVPMAINNNILEPKEDKYSLPEVIKANFPSALTKSLEFKGSNVRHQQLDLCFKHWILSGTKPCKSFDKVGIQLIDDETYLVDHHNNIWNNNDLVNMYKKKLVNLVQPTREKEVDNLDLDFSVMYQPAVNPKKDYYDFWYFVFESNLVLFLLSLAWGLYGLSGRAGITNSFVTHHKMDSGFKLSSTSKENFINPLISFFGLHGSGKTTTIAIILHALYGLGKNILVFNQDYTKAAISKLCYKLGSLTVLHDDVLQKQFFNSSLSKFIMGLASKLPSRISTEDIMRGIMNASILTCETNIFFSNLLSAVKNVTGVFDRLLSFNWVKVEHSEQFWTDFNDFIFNHLACKQIFWMNVKWEVNPDIKKYISDQLKSIFSYHHYENYICQSRAINHIYLFTSFIYDNLLEMLWIQFDILNLADCRIMKGMIIHFTSFFRDSLIHKFYFHTYSDNNIQTMRVQQIFVSILQQKALILVSKNYAQTVKTTCLDRHLSKKPSDLEPLLQQVCQSVSDSASTSLIKYNHGEFHLNLTKSHDILNIQDDRFRLNIIKFYNFIQPNTELKKIFVSVEDVYCLFIKSVDEGFMSKLKSTKNKKILSNVWVVHQYYEQVKDVDAFAKSTNSSIIIMKDTPTASKRKYNELLKNYVTPTLPNQSVYVGNEPPTKRRKLNSKKNNTIVLH